MTSALAQYLDAHRRVFVLTGAGCSTGSGIPDYRDAEGQWKRKPPVTFQAFVGDEATRRRYWARSLVGWPRFGQARPNGAHRALARLEATGRVELLLTQNVDRLHQAAGSRNVIDLHGRLDQIRCIACGETDLRAGFQLKPDVVFFGESVPRARVDAAMERLDEADAMLVVGSSLMVYSGYRFVDHAVRAGKPVAAVNLGRTRADDVLSLKIDESCEAAFAYLLDASEYSGS